MTSYSQDDYYYNNENDALSCNSRPISSTIHRTSSNKYESEADAMYNSYANADGDIGGMNVLDVVAPYMRTYEPTNAGVKTAPGMSGADGHGDYGPVAMEDSNSYSRNDNNIYQPNAYSYAMHDDYNSPADMADGRAAVGGQYWSDSSRFVEEGRHTSLGTIKMLPKLPIKHSSSMLDGMYTSHNQQRYGASLPTTPPVAQPKCRVLPQAVKCSQNSQPVAGVAGGAYGLHGNLNGHAGDSGFAVAAAAGATGGGVVIGKYLPTTPVRALPHPQARQSYLKRQLFEDAGTAPTATGTAATTAALSNDLYISSSYDNTTINNYNNYGGGLYSTPTPHANFAFDAFYPMQRPHTSMAPLDYAEYDYGYACNSAENLSAYSDSPAMSSSSSTQQKLQQQQRKHSIIMAMTTASVIASGETRIAPQKKKALIANLNNSNSVSASAASASADVPGKYVFEYDSSGAAAPKADLAAEPTAHQYYDATARSKYRTSANTNAIASARLSSFSASASSSPSPSPSLAIEPTVTTRTTTRKLPKRLPTPNIKYKATTPAIVTGTGTGNTTTTSSTTTTTTTTTTATTTTTTTTTTTSTGASTNSKQLPKLPQPKAAASAIIGTKFDEVTTSTPYLISPISAKESTSTSASTFTPSLAFASTTLPSLISTSSASASAAVPTALPIANSVSSMRVGASQLASSMGAEGAATSAFSFTAAATSTTSAPFESPTSASPSKLTICSISKVKSITSSSEPRSSIASPPTAPEPGISAADSGLDKSGRHLYDMFVDLSNNNTINDQLLFSERLSSSSTYFFDPLTTSPEPVAIKDNNLTTTADIPDYLKSYPPFPSYDADGSGSGIYHYDKSMYALPSSSSTTSTYNIPITATYSLPVEDAQPIVAPTKTYTSEDSSLSNGIFSNLNFSYSTSSDHYLPSMSNTIEERTTAVPTAIPTPTTPSSSFTIAYGKKTAEAISSPSSTSSTSLASCLRTTAAAAAGAAAAASTITDSGVTTSATKSISSLSFIAHTSTLPSSSLQELLSPTERNAINDASTLQSYPLSISTTTSTAMSECKSLDARAADTNTGLFTTTIAAFTTSTSPSTPNAVDVQTMAANDISRSTPAETTFADYLKGLDQYDCGSGSANESNSITSIKTTDASQIQTELPAYITDFLNTDYTKPYSTLLDYKFDDLNSESLADSASFSTQAPATDIYDGYDFTQSSSKFATTDYLSEMPSTATTAATPIATGFDVSDTWSVPKNAITTTVESTAISSAFDDSFYDSYKVDLSTLAASIITTEPSEHDTAVDALSMPTTAATVATTGTILDSQIYPYLSSSYSPLESYTNESDLTTTHTTVPIDYAPTTSAAAQQSFEKLTATAMTAGDTTTSASGTQGGYYKPATGKPASAAYEMPSFMGGNSVAATTAAVVTSASPQKTSTASASSATGKASSMLGGLSRGIKGGLDGVLSGVSAVADSTRQPLPQSSSIKGFGFGLASKLVPNVGGLLVGSAASSKQQQQTQPAQTVTTASESYSGAAISTATTKPTALFSEYDYQSTGNQFDCSSATTTATPTPTNEYLNAYKNDTILNTTATDSLLYTTDNSQSSKYNVSSGTTAYAMQHYPNDILNDGVEMMYGAESADQQEGLNLQKNTHLSDDSKYVYDEYGFSEYDYDMGGMYVDRAKHQEGGIVVVTTETGEIIATTTAAASELPFADVQQQQQPTKTTASTTVNGSGRTTLAKKTTSSLLSSLTSAASHVQMPQPTSQPAPKSTSSGGGMFGSFLGKAAAAMQSATQAVNQGASMATAVVQKIPSTSSATTSSTANFTNAESFSKVANTAATPGEYGLPMSSGDYHAQLLSHQDSLSSQYSTTGDDYENSNMLIYSTTMPIKGLPSGDRNDKQYVNYYSNGNQSQSAQQQQLQLQHQEQQQQLAKLLPTVPPAGSSGKKLPTINGKSGYLIKQQPTEIFEEDDNELLVNDDLIGGHEPNYLIDSEQDDYYMDHQQTSPSSRTALAGNGYYEHTNGGYDYREDYFNEEDEFKYLQKEEEQKAREELLYHQHHQIQQDQLMHHKHSSLDYAEEGNDNFIDDSYPSEDSGNYLDESSSGSVGVVGSKSKHEFPIDCIMQPTNSAVNLSPPAAIPAMRTSLAAMQTTGQVHQQIKKQDSIIMEEDEDELSTLAALASPLHAGLSKPPLSRKSSSILIDDDELSDLASIHISQKKKMLMRGESEDIVSGNMQMIRKPEVTAKQRWHWAYSKIIMQLNVSIVPISITSRKYSLCIIRVQFKYTIVEDIATSVRQCYE